jgi:hypothetical protein
MSRRAACIHRPIFHNLRHSKQTIKTFDFDLESLRNVRFVQGRKSSRLRNGISQTQGQKKKEGERKEGSGMHFASSSVLEIFLANCVAN